MPPLRIIAFLGLAAAPAAAEGLAPGSYDITYRLEVPHVERYAVSNAVQVCLAQTPGSALLALPVLSQNNPLAHCPARNIRLEGVTLRFDILCPGRSNDRSEAHAAYELAPGAFRGRIFMKMGGKNMTFVEVQSGRRTGPCGVAAAAPWRAGQSASESFSRFSLARLVAATEDRDALVGTLCDFCLIGRDLPKHWHRSNEIAQKE